ncbi:hypothetical protein PI124_g9411 [Phytophthora idaei]|nr:hypothetical protein PI125_g9085 [Phytophthora idaei]KAG3157269.1 hypothetical protein PI126_g8390 [Phytophthora idaei]KAG3245875.1 hypothetical protein PI124_g9411 [Phytophthora idaei]
MKFTFFVATFLAIASAAQAGDPQNAIQLSASAQDDHADVVLATPAPTTFTNTPTPAPTNFSDPTPAPTDSADTELEERSSASTTGIVGVAYSSEGTVGVAYTTTRAEYEAEKSSSNDSSSSATVPIAVVGCLVGVLGMVAAVVIVRKRKGAAEEGETDYSNGIRTPASVKAEEAYANIIHTPAAGEAGEVEYSNAIHTPVATV